MTEPDEPDEHEDGYAGPATLTLGGRDIPVQALLDARHEPQDGRLHWFGRVAVDETAGPEVTEALTSVSRVELSTEGGRAEAHIGDVDPWGRYRVTGLGPPPFPMAEPDLDD